MKIKLITCLALLCSMQVSAITVKKNIAPTDAGVINKTQILYWMEKRGELPANATPEQKQQAIAKFLSKKSFKAPLFAGKFGKKVMQVERDAIKAVDRKITKVKPSARVIALPNKSSEPSLTQVKVLAILIDFPDLKHDNNGLTSSDTGMYYSDYSVQHYNDLMFSTSGYEGPSGQNLQSAYQYYQQESGQGLAFTGQVFGWYTADNNAAYYGSNDPDNDNSDKNVPELILEAVNKAVAAGVDLSEYDQTDFFDLDGDGNIYEPDGIIDHVSVFHSSIGEEAGGGNLNDDAIWSHRFVVTNDSGQPTAVTGSSIKLYNYTIEPIDAAAGVVVHEFGHDLGVPDEYNTSDGTIGSPVANWSVMASGSWLGSPAGTKPSGFSPYVKDIYQNRYSGNWVSRQTIEFADLTTVSENIVAATNHQSGTNLIKVNLPPQAVDFGAPYTGDYQFYSGKGHLFTHSMSFAVNVPAGSSSLTMKARWDIELDYDYVQVLVNDKPIAGNHTQVTNPQHANVTNFITDKSLSITGAEGALGWVDLTFDLSAYADQNVTVKIQYVTDPAVGGYGFVADDIRVVNNNNDVLFYGGESENEVVLDGFSRIDSTIDGAAHSYYVQLRNYSETDSALAYSDYEPGVLVWYRNDGVDNNQVNEHPGKVFIGVVDADQNAIKRSNSISNTDRQIRDASFSLYDQKSVIGDNHLTANTKFDDTKDYSAPYQPESGIVVPKLGLTMEVTAQATDSSTATVVLTKSDLSYIAKTHSGLEVSFSVVDETANADTTYTWNMGDGTTLTGASISHTYAQNGTYTVTVNYQASSGSKSLSSEVTVGAAITGTITAVKTGQSVDVSSNLAGGVGNFTYRWDFGDGSNIVQNTTGSATHDYEQVGNYTITLSVTDDTLQAYTFTETVNIENNVTTTFTITTNNLAVTFKALPSGGDGNYTYAWDFGDGTSSTVAEPTHNYSAAGSYTVKLTVTDGTGLNAQYSTSVSVSAPVVQPPKKSSGSSGGGSIHWSLLLLLTLMFTQRKIKY